MILVLRVIHIRTTFLSLDELILITHEQWVSIRLSFHGALHPMDDKPLTSLHSMDDYARTSYTLPFPSIFFKKKKNHVKNTGQPDPKPNWPKPIFNPLKMTHFWPVTRLTRPESNPTCPLCHVYFQWYVNYSYLIFHILFIYRCYNNYLCQKNFYDCNNWCGI